LQTLKLIHEFFLACSIFSAVIGSGTQLLVLVFFIFGLSLVGVFYPYNRGALNTACLVIYALTAGISGYVSAHLYRQMGGEAWVMFYPLTLYISILVHLLLLMFLNRYVAMYYTGSRVLLI
jgi:transmembrane 9 superfamily protein 1